MTEYFWPANVTTAHDLVVLTLPDWSDMSVSGNTFLEATLVARLRLGEAVRTRIHAKASIPIPGVLGPRQIPVHLPTDVAPQLEGYLEEDRLNSSG